MSHFLTYEVKVVLIFMKSLIKFQSMVPEIQMKRAKHDIHTYIHTDDQPCYRISISSLKIVKITLLKGQC